MTSAGAAFELANLRFSHLRTACDGNEEQTCRQLSPLFHLPLGLRSQV
jgi:hypothetical protein